MTVTTRFAPSPTGFLHIGGLRTALYSYAWAKKNKGKFVLRIEDTDKKREVEGGVKGIIDALKLFQMNYDEGPNVGGPNGPYIQSQRLEIYKKKAEELVEKGFAYYCFCTQERLSKLREKQQKEKKQPKYDKHCLKLSKEEVEKNLKDNVPYVIRLNVPKDRIISVEDTVMGHVEWNTNDVDDQVLLKSDGYPTYHLAVVVDDTMMGITHITRGIEWLASVPKHILLYEAFNLPLPTMSHMPVILDPEGGKLSKRKGTVSVEGFISEGYLPSALLNFMMLLGWSAPIERKFGQEEQEFFSLSEFVELFDIKDLNKASPVFNREKLQWFNHKYISKLTPDELVLKFTSWLEKYSDQEDLKKIILEKGPDYLEKTLEITRDRAKLLSNFLTEIEPFYFYPKKIDFSEIKQTKKLDKKQIQNIIENFLLELEKYKSFDDWGHQKWEEFVRDLAEKLEIKAGEAFMTLRIKALGTPFSPPLFESMQILGKDEVLNRLKK